MRGKSHFEDDSTQNYFVFQPIYRYFKKTANSIHILVSQSKGLSVETIKPPATSNIAPSLNYNGVRPRINFDGSEWS